MKKCEEKQAPKPGLIAYFELLEDPRMERRRRHNLPDILVIALCTLLCGGESFNDMEDFGKAKEDWLRTFLKLPGGIPSHDTFNRVFAAIDRKQFMDCFMRWTQSLRRAVHREIVALDGKALRRASGQNDPLPYIVSAWARENGLVLGQMKVDEKSNEITAVPELLQVLELEGCIVTLDAMGCQKKIAEAIINRQADYVLALKGNQGTVHEEVKDLLDDLAQRAVDPGPSTRVFQEVDKDHGRIEIRNYWQSDDLEWFADRPQWKGLQSVGMVEATRQIGDRTTVERRYYLSSLPLDAECFARAVRGHWGVENSLHWVMDVDFGEDNSRARNRNSAENLALLRRLALNLIQKETSNPKRSIRRKIKYAGWNNDFLLKLLGF
ncbi:MAG: ISAs1 family transposase [Acidobacteria bacterium]|nr:ISAs1 family transposase [Acidobacteriota bacterium]